MPGNRESTKGSAAVARNSSGKELLEAVADVRENRDEKCHLGLLCYFGAFGSTGPTLTVEVSVVVVFGGISAGSRGLVTSFPVRMVEAMAASADTSPVPATRAAILSEGSVREPAKR